MVENCSALLPSAYDNLRELSAGGIVFLAVLCSLTVITVGIFVEEVYFIVHHFDCWRKLSRTLWLLGLYPVFSFTSLLAIIVPRSGTLCDFVSAIYLSACLVEFLRLIINYYGGEEQMCVTLSEKEIPLRSPPLACCLCCLPSTRLTLKNLVRIKLAVFQVALLRPLLMFIATVLWSDGEYQPSNLNPASAYLYITLINAVSTLIAMYGLVLVFRVSREPLKAYKITQKFAVLQLSIICSNLQGFIFSMIALSKLVPCTPPLSSQAQGAAMNHSAIVCEMFLLSVWSRWLYRNKLQGNIYRNLGPEIPDNTSEGSHIFARELHSGISSSQEINNGVVRDYGSGNETVAPLV